MGKLNCFKFHHRVKLKTVNFGSCQFFLTISIHKVESQIQYLCFLIQIITIQLNCEENKYKNKNRTDDGSFSAFRWLMYLVNIGPFKAMNIHPMAKLISN